MSRSGNVSVAVRVRPTGGVTSSSNCMTLDRERGKISVRNNDGGMHHFDCDRVRSSSITSHKKDCLGSIFVDPVVGLFVFSVSVRVGVLVVAEPRIVDSEYISRNMMGDEGLKVMRKN
jgi:hypothetical protein